MRPITAAAVAVILEITKAAYRETTMCTGMLAGELAEIHAYAVPRWRREAWRPDVGLLP